MLQYDSTERGDRKIIEFQVIQAFLHIYWAILYMKSCVQDVIS